MAKTRGLSSIERQEAQQVFSAGLDLNQVRIRENVAWTLLVARLGARIRSQAPPPANAVTLGTTIYFSRPLSIRTGGTQADDLNDMAWLVHELVHVWQFRHLGWFYIPRALKVHLRGGSQPYDYGGAGGLRQAEREGRSLTDFNLEQQGDIARDFYLHLRLHAEIQPWESFVVKLHSG